MEQDDASIILLLMERNEDALSHLVATHGPQVKGSLMKQFGNLFDEEDIMIILHEAARRVWLNAEKLDDSKGSLGAWYYKIALNYARDLLRGRKKQADRDRTVTNHLKEAFPSTKMDGQRVPLEPQVAPTALPEYQEEALPSQDVAALMAAIATLPPLQKAIIEADLAAMGEGHEVASSAVLAKMLNSTQNSIYVSRKKARESLKKALSGAATAKKASARQ